MFISNAFTAVVHGHSLRVIISPAWRVCHRHTMSCCMNLYIRPLKRISCKIHRNSQLLKQWRRYFHVWCCMDHDIFVRLMKWTYSLPSWSIANWSDIFRISLKHLCISLTSPPTRYNSQTACAMCIGIDMWDTNLFVFLSIHLCLSRNSRSNCYNGIIKQGALFFILDTTVTPPANK